MRTTSKVLIMYAIDTVMRNTAFQTRETQTSIRWESRSQCYGFVKIKLSKLRWFNFLLLTWFYVYCIHTSAWKREIICSGIYRCWEDHVGICTWTWVFSKNSKCNLPSRHLCLIKYFFSSYLIHVSSYPWCPYQQKSSRNADSHFLQRTRYKWQWLKGTLKLTH